MIPFKMWLKITFLSLISLILTLILNLIIIRITFSYELFPLLIFIMPLLSFILTFLGIYLYQKRRKISRLRRLLFITYSILVILVIDAMIISILGTIIEPQNIKIIEGRAYLPDGTYFMRPPPCPAAAAYVTPIWMITHKIPYPTELVLLLGMFFFWFLFVLILGRGFCAWVCPFGGIDEFFRGLSKKVRINLEFLREFAYFRLIFFFLLVLAGTILKSAIFCEWICPLQIFYTPPQLTTISGVTKGIIIFTLALSLLIVLPFLSKKRTFCGLFCPVGGINEIVGLISPFRVKYNIERCSECKNCERVCPLFVEFNKKGYKGNFLLSCSKCGECVDKCPKGALRWTFLNKEIDHWFPTIMIILIVNLIIFVSGAGIPLILKFLKQ